MWEGLEALALEGGFEFVTISSDFEMGVERSGLKSSTLESPGLFDDVATETVSSFGADCAVLT